GRRLLDAAPARGLPAGPACRPRQSRPRRRTRAPLAIPGRALRAWRGARRGGRTATMARSFGHPPSAHSAFPAVSQLVGSRSNYHFKTLRRGPHIAMPKINAIDLKPGNVLEHQNKLWIVLKRELVQPGKGGSFAQVELRDLRGGTKLNERFRTQETVERVRLDEKEMQFLYMEGDQATLMDNDSFEQVSVPRDLIGHPADFLLYGMICHVIQYTGAALAEKMPPSVVMQVVEA